MSANKPSSTASSKPRPNHLSELDVKIDFDDAHKNWIQNKRKTNGNYVYICGYKKCRNQSFDKSGIYSGCKKHKKWEEEEAADEETPSIPTTFEKIKYK